ncbi:hypothetical protein [Thiospirillum jenense]|uniref:Uncharacterized protein n=1 Tax=Thiospirillum jenense TaxID=1653858 RepID=A0A839H9G0_9GAMM|nr:hypothetical protein [Thiospirillum jenense]MBB1125933.1 hypothetical protein [Thiospirillum jenense]
MALLNPNLYGTLTSTTPTFTLPEQMRAIIIDADGGQSINIANGASLALSSSKGTNSFNIQADSTAFVVSRSGATVTLLDNNSGQQIEIPATTSEQTIRFGDGSVKLVISSGAVKLGSQALTETALAISASLNADDSSASFFSNQITKNLDTLGGTQQVPSSFDTGDGAYLLTDAASVPNVVRVTDFGADDQLKLTATAELLSIESSNTDAIVTINDNGIVSQITLAEILTNNDIVYNLESFNALPVGDILLASNSAPATTKDVDNLGTATAPAAFDAGSGAFSLKDTAAAPNFVDVSNFGADDVIQFESASQSLLSISSWETNVTMTINQSGVISQLNLIGVTTASSLVFDVNSFDALPVGNISFV